MLPQPDMSQSAEISRRFLYDEKLNPYRNGLPAEKQENWHNGMRSVYSIMKNKDTISRVTFWGVDDGGSWLNRWPSQDEQATRSCLVGMENQSPRSIQS